MPKRFEREDAQKLIDQPIDGLLYDLNLLPEVLSAHNRVYSREWVYMMVIKTLKDENEQLKNDLKIY